MDDREKLVELLSGDLDFHDQGSQYASHNFHSFPAKFPPQLPAKFIDVLTAPGDRVLDPMNGSGTTTLEAFLAGRRGLGLDIDPLAVKIGQVKITPVNILMVNAVGENIVTGARVLLKEHKLNLERQLETRWDADTRRFIDNWFAPITQLELVALLSEIEKIEDGGLRNFFELSFSAIVITKSGGVSLALDLAHTRPHKAKVIVGLNGNLASGEDDPLDPTNKARFSTKRLRSPIDEFQKRYRNNLRGLVSPDTDSFPASVTFGSAQRMPLPHISIDLIITSPPYASNAIDYMRAHKFSLVWLGHKIGNLGKMRNEYIGGEATSKVQFEILPPRTQSIVRQIAALDVKKGQVLHRYYSEMTQALREMYRVLKPGKAAIVVVGSSVMRGRDTETQNCLAEIGETLGFEVPKIGVRVLDRDRRMMPAGLTINRDSQIQQRMHEEYVIGYYKPG